MTRQFGAVGRSVCKKKKNSNKRYFFLILEILSRSVGKKKNVRGHSVLTRVMSDNTVECL